MDNKFFSKQPIEMSVYAGRQPLNQISYGISCGIYSTEDIIHNILTAKTMQDIHAQCICICNRYGFDFFALMELVHRPNHPPLLFRMLDYINKFAIHYENKYFYDNDPGVRIARQRGTPFIMAGDASNYTLTSQERCVIHDAIDFGMREIFYAPFNDCFGSNGFVRFMHNEGGKATAKERAKPLHIQAELFLLSSYIHSAVIQLLVAGQSRHILSEREKEVLRWTAAGTNPARIGDILLISENTVCNHLKNIRIKMGVKNTTHAVAKALMERLIII